MLKRCRRGVKPRSAFWLDGRPRYKSSRASFRTSSAAARMRRHWLHVRAGCAALRMACLLSVPFVSSGWPAILGALPADWARQWSAAASVAARKATVSAITYSARSVSTYVLLWLRLWSPLAFRAPPSGRSLAPSRPFSPADAPRLHLRGSPVLCLQPLSFSSMCE